MPLAVLTGAGSGIGAALAHALAARDYDLFLIGRSSRVETIRDAISQQNPGRAVTTAQVDLAERDDRHELLGRIRDVAFTQGTPVGALVHAAGVGKPSPDLARMDSADLEHAFAVNVTAALELTQGLLNDFSAGNVPSRVLLIGAGVDDKPQPGTGSYGISKLALKRLWRQLRIDLARNAAPRAPLIGLFQPGVVDTPGLHAHIEAAQACELPHADYLQGAIDAGWAYAPATVACAITRLLNDITPEAFSQHEWRTADLTPTA